MCRRWPGKLAAIHTAALSGEEGGGGFPPVSLPDGTAFEMRAFEDPGMTRALVPDYNKCADRCTTSVSSVLRRLGWMQGASGV